MAKDRKETLLAVGERLFAQHGYRDIGIKDIAESAGLGTASFYTYFPSKESFYAEIVTRLEERWIREAEKRVGGFQSPLNKLKALYRSTLPALQGNTILRGVYAGEKRFQCPGLDVDPRGRLFAQVESLIGRILAEGGRKGIFRTNVFKNPTEMLLGVFRSLFMDGEWVLAGDLLADTSLLVERGIKRWLRLRLRDERLDRRASRRSSGAGSQTE